MRELFDRIPGRTAAVVAALVLAIVAAVALRSYVSSVEQELASEAELQTVFVAKVQIGVGIAGTAILATMGTGDPGLREANFPVSEIPPDAITGLDQIKGFALETIGPGDILLTSMFGEQPPPSDTFEVPVGQVAVSIDVEVTAAVANFLDPDDRISILVNLDTTADGAEGAAGGQTTRYVLQDVRILSIGRRVTATAGGAKDTVVRDDGLLTLTLAVDAVDAERLVFAQFTGTLYLTLLPDRVDDFQPTTSTGRNTGNLFNR